jgi:hypothetical protein
MAAVSVLVIVTTAVLMYLRPVFELGFYYDDWPVLAAFGDATGQSWSEHLALCRRELDPAGRLGSCLYSTTVNATLGADAAAYHVLALVLLIVCALLVYLLLVCCQLGHWPSLVAAVLFVIYPGSDSTRLWGGAVFGQYVLALYLCAVLLAIAGLRRTGARSLAWHATSFGLFVLVLFTYEVVVPLIAVAGGFYLLAARASRRAALMRASIDLTLVFAFVVYRLAIAPPPPGSGFAQDRTIGQTIDRVSVVVHGGWASFRPLFLPGTAAMIVVIVGACIWIASLAKYPSVRRQSLRWLIAGAAAAAFAIVSVLVYVIANDLYVPQPDGTFNRLNLAAAPAYCVGFVALCGLLWTALSHWLPNAVATVVVASLVLWIVPGQVAREQRSQDAWATSWDEQQVALAKLRTLTPEPDRDASVMSFGHPIWERNHVPVFSASWDLRGAIDFETQLDPPVALPFLDSAQCGPKDVLLGSVPFHAYRASSPLWFVNVASGEARRISTAAQCNAAVADWGRPPFWGSTVTGS